jgi:hypothetical protein
MGPDYNYFIVSYSIKQITSFIFFAAPNGSGILRCRFNFSTLVTLWRNLTNLYQIKKLNTINAIVIIIAACFNPALIDDSPI